jgi:hypothetical protein
VAPQSGRLAENKDVDKFGKENKNKNKQKMAKSKKAKKLCMKDRFFPPTLIQKNNKMMAKSIICSILVRSTQATKCGKTYSFATATNPAMQCNCEVLETFPQTLLH